MCHFQYDVKKNQVVHHSYLKPTDLAKDTNNALWAENNRYRKNLLWQKNVGKWTLFFDTKTINEVWKKVKIAIEKNDLWKAEVKRTNHKLIKNGNQPFNADFVLIIYTRSYRYLCDAVAVLDYLEAQQIKVRHETIYFQKQRLTKKHHQKNDLRQGGYSSDQIRDQKNVIMANILLTFSFIALPVLLINESWKWMRQKQKKKKQVKDKNNH